MTTSGTATFNLDVIECIEEAYEQCGLEMRSGYDVKTARRSLNLLALDWANRGYNLWTVEQGVIPFLSGVSAYGLPDSTIDVVEMVLRTTSGATYSDASIARIGMPVYAAIPVKTQPGRPTQVWIDRQTSPRISVWPVPDASTYSLIFWYMRRIQDAGTSGETTLDIPQRFLPCLIAGLAYKIAMKRPECESRLDRLKAEYEEQWLSASTEDREKVTLRLVPARTY